MPLALWSVALKAGKSGTPCAKTTGENPGDRRKVIAVDSTVNPPDKES